MYKYLFGPVYSRRFGISLGVDLSPYKKSCNFDCLYCELGKARPVSKIENPPEVKEIVEEIKDFLSKNPPPDYITITANGEPTLFEDLEDLIDQINKVKSTSKTLILTNGSTIHQEKTQKALLKFDEVKVSLDAVSEDVFKKVDKPFSEISVRQIIEGLKQFRRVFSGKLIIEVLLVKFVNDDKEEVKKLAKTLKLINPDKIDIGTIDRPPAYRVFPLSNEELYSLSEIFEREGLNVNVVERKGIYTPEFDLTAEDILNTLHKRPLTEEDIESLFSENTKRLVYLLEQEGKVKRKKVAGKEFLYA